MQSIVLGTADYKQQWPVRYWANRVTLPRRFPEATIYPQTGQNWLRPCRCPRSWMGFAPAGMFLAAPLELTSTDNDLRVRSTIVSWPVASLCAGQFATPTRQREEDGAVYVIYTGWDGVRRPEQFDVLLPHCRLYSAGSRHYFVVGERLSGTRRRNTDSA